MLDVHEQRRDARERANAVRSRNAQLKRSLKSGTLSLADAFDHPDLQTWSIGDLVGFACIGESRYKGQRTPQRAPHLALALLEAGKVGKSRPVGDVTTLERNLMLAEARRLQARREQERHWRLRRGGHSSFR